MKSKGAMVVSATAMVLAAGVLAAHEANADTDRSSGMHKVAFLADKNLTGNASRHGVNSFKMVNKNTEGGTNCFNVSSLTTEGGAYTTNWKVLNDTEVLVFAYTSDNCSGPGLYKKDGWYEYPKTDTHEYFYISVLGPS